MTALCLFGAAVLVCVALVARRASRDNPTW